MLNMFKKRGKLISIDGPDCSGKDSLIEALSLPRKFVYSREPGGTEIGEKIRNLVLDIEHEEMDEITTFLLFSAARRQHVVSKIEPELKKGNHVVLNRYYYSSTIYQAMLSNNGKGLSVPFVSDTVRESIRIGEDMMVPDLSIILFTSDFSILEERLKSKQNKDRLESNDIKYFERINNEYADIHFNEYVGRIESDSNPKYIWIDIAKYVDDIDGMVEAVQKEIFAVVG